MEGIHFFLRPKARRRWRRDLIRFWDGLALHLRVGYELGYAWRETLSASQFMLPAFRDRLLPGEEESTRDCLARLTASFPFSEYRLWFSILGELYAQGAGLTDVVEGIAASLRREQERDLEAHCRTLPTRANIWLLIFFLPPALALLFVPLLDSIGAAL